MAKSLLLNGCDLPFFPTVLIFMQSLIFFYLIQSVFPVDDENLEDPFITIDELFSGSTPAAADPNTQLPLSMQRLRKMLARDIQQSGRLTA